jgi:hypothetical protein
MTFLFDGGYIIPIGGNYLILFCWPQHDDFLPDMTIVTRFWSLVLLGFLLTPDGRANAHTISGGLTFVFIFW